MKIIIGVDPSTKGYHEICAIDRETFEILASIKRKGNQATIHTIQSLVAQFQDNYDDPKIIIGIEHQNSLLRDAAQAFDIPIYAVDAGKVKSFLKSTTHSNSKTDPIDAEAVCCYLSSVEPKLTIYRPPTQLEWDAQVISKQLTHIKQTKTLSWQQFWATTAECVPELKEHLGNKANSLWFLKCIHEMFAKKGFKHTSLKAFTNFCQRRRATDSSENFFASLLKMLKKLHAYSLAAQVLPIKALLILSLMEEEKVWLERAREKCQEWDAGLFIFTIKCLTPKTAIRLLAFIGEDWSKTTPAKISAYAGQAPEVSSTGRPTREDLNKMPLNKRRRYEPRKFMRRACNHELQTVFPLFSFSTLEKHAWVDDAYTRFRSRGQTHWEALRNISLKWIRVIYAVIRDQVPYDSYKHERNISKRQDSLVLH